MMVRKSLALCPTMCVSHFELDTVVSSKKATPAINAAAMVA
jgi:hypothetical protein